MKNVFKRALAVLLVIVMMTSTYSPFLHEVQAASFSYTGSSSYRSGKYYTRLKNLTKTGNQRVDIVNVAESQIGYQEGASSSKLSGEVRGSGNYTEYGRWYGMQDMWCAMFVSWCAHVAGVPTSVVPSHSYTPSGLSWFKSRGLAYSRKQVANGEYTPQPGDIIYFKSSRNQNTTNHIGIVTGYSNGTVYTVEGNTSSATISTNGGAVASKSYSISNTYIVYICKPNYSVPSVQEETVAEPLKGVVFNSDYYAWKCANEYGVNPGSTEAERYKHYINTGIKNGYQASPNFDVKYYLENNPHVQTAIGSSTDYKKAYQYFIDQGYLEVVLTAKPEDIGHDFYAEIVMASSGMLLSANSDDRNVILSDTSVSRSKKWRFFRKENGVALNFVLLRSNIN